MGEDSLVVSQPQQQVDWVDVITVTLTVNLDARASHVEGRCRSEHPPAAFQGTRVLLDSSYHNGTGRQRLGLGHSLDSGSRRDQS